MTMIVAGHPPVFVDGLGARYLVRDEKTGDLVEHLLLDPELVESPGFIVALGERVSRLGAFRNACYARVGHVEAQNTEGAALVSEFTYGWRLSQVLDVSEREHVSIGIGSVFGLIRQLLPAVALLSQHARDVVHGALGPERLILTPQGRLVVTEHVFGSAVDALQYGRERLWQDFRIATPPSAGLPRMGPRTDVMQIGLTALALVLGRNVGQDEFPAQLEALVNDARARLSENGTAALSQSVGEWLSRALQIEPRASFQSPFDAQASLERVLSDHHAALDASVPVETLLATLAPSLPPVVPADAEVPPVAEEPMAAEAAPVAEEPMAEEPPALEPVSEPSAQAEAPAPANADARTSSTSPSAEPPLAAPNAVDAPPAARSSRRVLVALAAVAVIALLEAALLLMLWNQAPEAGLGTDGELVVQSRPLAARVIVDGEERGVTPLTLRLPAGSHVLQVAVGGAEPRVIPLMIQPGVQTAQYVEMLNVPTTGVLVVRTDPARARVTVDGRDYGQTPVTIRDLPPGDREVVLERGSQRVVQRVRVEPGSTAQLVVPLPQ